MTTDRLSQAGSALGESLDLIGYALIQLRREKDEVERSASYGNSEAAERTLRLASLMDNLQIASRLVRETREGVEGE